jgi:ribosomal protein S12 methylthiotransferase accessory factor
MDDYKESLKRMYGEKDVDLALKSLSGEIRFHGLEETDLNLKGLKKHLRLIESYKKIKAKRQENI